MHHEKKTGNWNGRAISLYNSDLSLLEFCKQVLEEHGIVCNLYVVKKGKNEGMGDLRIYRKTSFQQFYDTVPFRSAIKRERMRRVLLSYQDNPEYKSIQWPVDRTVKWTLVDH